MATPYITAQMLASAPAGVAWTVIPSLQATSAENAAEVMQACWRATSVIDGFCHQPLRCAVVSDQLTGPGRPRITVDRDTLRGTLVTHRGPVRAVLSVQLAPAAGWMSTGTQWTTVPAGQYRPRHPMLTTAGPDTTWSGGYSIDIAAGWLNWDLGRAGWDVRYSFLPGWPHTSLTAPAAQGATTVAVDDVTGWAGVAGNVYDGVSTETAQAASVAASSPVILPDAVTAVPAGPGTLTLAAPLGYAHPAGTVFSALPPAVIHAAVLAATVQAIEGIDAVATQSLNAQFAGGSAALAEEYELMLADGGYVRVF
jgi:hypothetical protein